MCVGYPAQDFALDFLNGNVLNTKTVNNSTCPLVCNEFLITQLVLTLKTQLCVLPTNLD
jgi:hypothetical protein